MIRTNIFTRRAAEFVEKEFVFPNTQVLSHKEYVEGDTRYIDVNLIGESLPMDSLRLAMMTKMNKVGLGGTILNIKQGFGMGQMEVSSQADNDNFLRLMENELASKQSKIDSLRTVLSDRKRLTDQSCAIAPEIRVLFPSVRAIAVSEMLAASTTAPVTDTVTIAFIDAPAGMPESQRTKLADYLQVRLKRNKVNITLNPASFPWPQKKVEE